MQNSRNAQISDVKASRVLFEFLVNQKIVNRTIFLTINRLVNSHFFAALKNIALSCNDCSNMPHLCDACCAAEKRKKRFESRLHYGRTPRWFALFEF